MFADAHCDTITRIIDQGQLLYENDGHIDIKRLKDNFILQYLAIFIHPKYSPFDRFNQGINKFYEEYEKNKEYIKLVLNGDDIGDKIGVLLTIEGGSAIEGSLEKLHYAYEKGIRCMTLTWNGNNEICDGVMEGEHGLTDFGKQVVKEMNNLGMIIDVSHLTERGFYNVAELSKVPFMASHSNCKSLCNHKRNLTDEQIKHIINIGGFIGLNLCPDFLAENGANITDIIKHAQHILELGGEDVLGFGCDFDGVDDLPENIDGVQNMNNVLYEFCKMGYDQNLINKLFYGNLCKYTKQILKK